MLCAIRPDGTQTIVCHECALGASRSAHGSSEEARLGLSLPRHPSHHQGEQWKSVERIGDTQCSNHIGVRVSHGHYFGTRRIKQKRWMCGSAARAMLAHLHVQFKTRRRLTFEAERPLIPSTAGPANQPQAQCVDASQRYASTAAVRLIRTGRIAPRVIGDHSACSAARDTAALLGRVTVVAKQ
jgi:hypothetical protein